MAATQTPRLNLNMPNESDFVNVITDINENMQNIDDAFGMIGSQYDPTATYQKDDYCMHEAKVYRALQDIDTPEEWDETHWTESDITDEIKRTANSISTTASTIREEIRNFENELDIVIVGNTASVNVTAGQYVTVRDSTITGITDGIYKATANVAAGTAFVAANLSAVTSGALNDLSGNIANIDSKVSSLITTGEHDITAGATGTIEKTKDVSKTGYKPIGVIGLRAIVSYTGTKFDYCYVSGNTLYYRFHDAASAATGCKFTILYVKS